MAMNFGTGNRSIAFNPTSAFPLDARSYFESYELASMAAASAEPAGSTNTQYYYGQTLVVVENDIANFYIIQPTKKLSPINVTGDGDENTKIEIDANQFSFDDNGALILRGSKAAKKNSLISIDENGVLNWIDPIDTYTKEQIDNKFTSISHLSRKIVSSVEDIQLYIKENEDAEFYIFMVPTGLESDSDKYDEYMVYSITDTDGVVTQYPEKIGTWEVNLDDYVKVQDFEAELLKKVDADDNARLITNEEAQKLENIEDYAQENVIQTVSNDFSIVTDSSSGLIKQLQLNKLSIEKIDQLQENLDKKVDTIQGYSLLSPTDKEKLDALVLGEQGNLEISGSVNAENIVGLSEWITENAGTVEGLSQNNFTTSLYQKLSRSAFIQTVNQEQLEISSGQLSIIALDKDKVTGLNAVLNQKASAQEVEILKTNVNNLSNTVNTFSSRIDTVATRLSNCENVLANHTQDLENIKESLTWVNL